MLKGVSVLAVHVLMLKGHVLTAHVLMLKAETKGCTKEEFLPLQKLQTRSIYI